MWLDKRSMSKASDTAIATDVEDLQQIQNKDSQPWWDISVSKSNVRTSRTWKVGQEKRREAKPENFSVK